ncbi:hypothetical protein IVB14_17670 [Bradyrhizobium sp. 180]|uniref:hypothetical protein n=1 Tax=Bradyrhizobium sp. 180 TaxID=2782650 RepID=UPI001FF71F26|nr:hypothetical protein [Bradyrhizobium sp. 180]MCK1492200.1 hypothetical protein [Bradyrhizobium sp. 180]
MDTVSITVHQIEAQIADGRERLAQLDLEAQGLAMSVVSGDKDAAASLASINVQIQQITADLAVLERARLSAAQEQRAANEALAIAARARHMADARASAARLIEIAQKIDRAHAAILPALKDLDAAELAIWNSLRLASAQPSVGVVGQRNLAILAMDRLSVAATGKTMFLSDQRCVEEVAATAWASLLASEKDEASDD